MSIGILLTFHNRVMTYGAWIQISLESFQPRLQYDDFLGWCLWKNVQHIPEEKLLLRIYPRIVASLLSPNYSV